MENQLKVGTVSDDPELNLINNRLRDRNSTVSTFRGEVFSDHQLGYSDIKRDNRGDITTNKLGVIAKL